MFEQIRKLKDAVMADFEATNAAQARTMTAEELALCGGGWGQIEPDGVQAGTPPATTHWGQIEPEGLTH